MYNCLDVCPHLEKVTIRQCGSHACGTEALRCLPKLNFLEIHVLCGNSANDLQMEDGRLDAFCFPEQIDTLVLCLQAWAVDMPKLCNSLTVLQSLVCLHLCQHGVGGERKLSLSLLHLRSLESLHLQGFRFAEEWAFQFSCLTKLTLLSFAGLYEPVPLHELASLPALQTLHLAAHRAHHAPVHGDIYLHLDNLPELPPTLRELRVIGLTWERDVSSLRGFSNLRVCMLHGPGFLFPPHIPRLDTLVLPAHMPHLQTLLLDHNDGLVLEDQLTGFTALRLLSLRGCGQVAVPSAFHRLAALPHLTCIDVAGSLPGNQLDWSAYEGLPLHGGVPSSLPTKNSGCRSYRVREGMVEYEE